MNVYNYVNMHKFLFFAALFIFLTSCSDKKTAQALPKLPEKTGTLQLTHIIQGVEADKFMYRMHGKMTGTHSSIIGYYGNNRKNVLYISSFETPESAEKALTQMAVKIKKGSSGFTPAKKTPSKEGMIYRTDGMGLKHFFYRSGNFLIWWQAEPVKAELTFQELHTFKSGE